VAGRRIVLVDDVITTGATVQAAARVLKAAGAARVDVLALAVVVI
jgi:predicted amidophosphoribosyltransferase